MDVVILTVFTARALYVSMYGGLTNCRMPLISFFATSAPGSLIYVHHLNPFCSVPRNVMAAASNSVPLSAQCFV